MIAPNEILIDPEFEARHRTLSEDEREQLAIQVDRFGFREPIVVWQHHNILLDGHNRLDIWRTKLDADPDNEPEVVEYKFKDRTEALEWIDKNQRARRNLTANELSVLRGREYREEKKESHRPKKGDIMSPLKGKTSETLSEKHGVSPKQIKRDAKFSKAVETIEENVGKEATKELLSDKPPISRKAAERIASQPADQQKEAYEEEKQNSTQKRQTKKVKPMEYVRDVTDDAFDVQQSVREAFRQMKPEDRPQFVKPIFDQLLEEDCKSW